MIGVTMISSRLCSSMARTSLLAMVCLALPASGWARPVTLETRATSLGELVPRLGELAGERWSVSQDLSRELFVVRLSGADSAEVKSRLAQAVGAEWVEASPGDWRLERSPELRQKQSQADRERIVTALRSNLNRRPGWEGVEVGEAVPAEDIPAEQREQMRRMQQIQQQRDELWGKVVDEAVKLISIERIAALLPDQRIVFSTRPRGRQVGLSGNLSSQIEGFNRATRSMTTGDEGMAAQAMLPMSYLMIVAQRDTPLSYRLVIRGYAENGAMVNFSQRDLGPSANPMFGFDSQGVPKPELPFALNEPKAKIETPQELKALTDLLQNMNQGAPPGFGQMQRAFEFFQDPIKNEPLATVPSLAMLAIAQDQKSQLIAYVGDDQMSMLEGAFSGEAFTREEALRSMVESGTVNLSREGSWLVIQPSYPSLMTQTRLNRSSLKTMIDANRTRGGATFEEQIAYYSTFPDHSPIMFQIYSIFATRQGMGGMLGDDTNQVAKAFRFLGALTPPQRQVLFGGGALAVAEMSGTQRTLFDICLNAANDFRTPPADPGASFFGGVISTGLDPSNPLGVVDTSEFGMQDFAGGFVRGYSFQNWVLQAFGGDFFSTMVGPMDIDMYASMVEMMSRNTGQEMMMEMPSFDKLRPGRRDTLLLRFHITQSLGSQARLDATRINMSGEPTDESGLPAELRELIRKRREAIRNMMSPGGDGTPPAEGEGRPVP